MGMAQQCRTEFNLICENTVRLNPSINRTDYNLPAVDWIRCGSDFLTVHKRNFCSLTISEGTFIGKGFCIDVALTELISGIWKSITDCTDAKVKKKAFSILSEVATNSCSTWKCSETSWQHSPETSSQHASASAKSEKDTNVSPQ